MESISPWEGFAPFWHESLTERGSKHYCVVLQIVEEDSVLVLIAYQAEILDVHRTENAQPCSVELIIMRYNFFEMSIECSSY